MGAGTLQGWRLEGINVIVQYKQKMYKNTFTISSGLLVLLQFWNELHNYNNFDVGTVKKILILT